MPREEADARFVPWLPQMRAGNWAPADRYGADCVNLWRSSALSPATRVSRCAHRRAPRPGELGASPSGVGLVRAESEGIRIADWATARYSASSSSRSETHPQRSRT